MIIVTSNTHNLVDLPFWAKCVVLAMNVTFICALLVLCWHMWRK